LQRRIGLTGLIAFAKDISAQQRGIVDRAWRDAMPAAASVGTASRTDRRVVAVVEKSSFIGRFRFTSKSRKPIAQQFYVAQCDHLLDLSAEEQI
jgi:hypothetical protein